MNKKIKYTIIGGVVAIILAAGAVGMWYGTTYPTYDIKSISIAGGDDTLSGTDHTAGIQTNKWVATVDGTSKHGGKPNISWSLLYINEQGSVPAWLTIKSDPDLQSHIEWTNDAIAGSYTILVQANTQYHSLHTTILTIS